MKSAVGICSLLVGCSWFSGFSQIHVVTLPDYYVAASASPFFRDVFSFSVNQSVLASADSAAAGICSERKFELRELGAFFVNAAFPLSYGGLGLSLAYSGDKYFSTSRIGVAYGRRLSELISIGAELKYAAVSMGMYGKKSAVSFDIATGWQLTRQLTVQFQARDPLRPRLAKSASGSFAPVYSMGCGFQASPRFYTALFIEKLSAGATIRFSFQYNPAEHIRIRAGISSGLSAFYLGWGIGWRNLYLDLSSAFHLQLGLSPALALSFNLHSKKREDGK